MYETLFRLNIIIFIIIIIWAVLYPTPYSDDTGRIDYKVKTQFQEAKLKPRICKWQLDDFITFI